MLLYPDSYEGEAPREFGRDAHVLKTRTFDLAVARDLEEVEIGGDCIWAMSGTTSLSNIDIRINDQLRDPLTFREGMSLKGFPFSRLYVSNAVQAGQVITIFFAVESTKAIGFGNPAVLFTTVDVTKSTVLDVIANVNLPGVTTTEVLPLNNVRRSAWITNLVGNVNTMWINGGRLPAENGLPLAPGDTIVINCTAQIFAYNPGGGAEFVSVLYTED